MTFTHDEFDPEGREADNTYEVEVTLTFEEYQVWDDDEGFLECRPIVARNSLNDHYVTAVDALEATDPFGWMLATDLKLWLTEELEK